MYCVLLEISVRLKEIRSNGTTLWCLLIYTSHHWPASNAKCFLMNNRHQTNDGGQMMWSALISIGRCLSICDRAQEMPGGLWRLGFRWDIVAEWYSCVCDQSLTMCSVIRDPWSVTILSCPLMHAVIQRYKVQQYYDNNGLHMTLYMCDKNLD